MDFFKGLSAFPITPLNQHGGIDSAGLHALMRRLQGAKVQSVGLLGSTGIYAYLNSAQRRQAVEVAACCLDGSLPLIVGVGALRTDEAKAHARDAARAGADALLLAPVCYTPLTDDEVYQHFLAVAMETDLPLCIYNNPGTTHFRFGHDLLARLGTIATIRAVKMPLPEKSGYTVELKHLRAILPADFRIGYSGDWGCAQALTSGADTWYSAVAGILPIPAAKLAKAAIAGDLSQTKRMDAYFQPLWKLFQEFGSLRVVYSIARALELTNATPPRPILELSGASHKRVLTALEYLARLA